MHVHRRSREEWVRIKFIFFLFVKILTGKLPLSEMLMFLFGLINILTNAFLNFKKNISLFDLSSISWVAREYVDILIENCTFFKRDFLINFNLYELSMNGDPMFLHPEYQQEGHWYCTCKLKVMKIRNFIWKTFLRFF